MDPSDIVRAFLFAIFAVLTAALAAVTGPTYDNLLVPELAPSALYPGLEGGGSWTLSGFLGQAASLSAYLLVNVVDPAIALVVVGLGLAYLVRASLARLGPRIDALLPKLVVAVILANFTLPIAVAILGVAGAAYPVFAGWDGGAWQHWVNLNGFGSVQFSWDNGLLAFIVSFALFALVVVLAIAVAVRDALLGVLLVVLPAFTLLWPIRPLASLATRGWLWFGELAFLPCVLVVPLELAVGAPNILLLLAFLTVAASAPTLVSVAGAQLSSLGFPSPGASAAGGLQRGFGAGALGADSYLATGASATRGSGRLGQALRSARSVTSAAFPVGIPLLAAEGVGRGTLELFRHVRRAPATQADRFPPLICGGPAPRPRP
jgi:hypothetical protein